MTANAPRDMLRQRLNSIFKCPVCIETYKDPRSLPCVHTFCLKCVQGFSRDKHPGDNVACPVCRRGFVIPANGINDRPRNFFIEQLKGVSCTSASYCEVCCDTETHESEIKQAVKFCVDCQQKCYEDCVDTHRRMQSLRGHKFVDIGDKESVVKPALICSTNHPKEALKLYCFDCEVAICFVCFDKLHKSCNCTDMNKVVDEFRKQMTDDVEKMAETVDNCRLMLTRQEENKKIFISVVEKIEKEICEQVERLKKVIDVEKRKLLQELETQKFNRMKQMQRIVEDIQMHMSFTDSLVKYTDELRNKGTASDIAQQRSSLHNRANEPTKLDKIHQEVKELGSTHVTFEPAEVSTKVADRLIGQIHWESDNYKL